MSVAPTTTPSSSNNGGDEGAGGDGVNLGLAVALPIVLVLLVAAVIVAIFFLLRWRKRRKGSSGDLHSQDNSKQNGHSHVEEAGGSSRSTSSRERKKRSILLRAPSREGAELFVVRHFYKAEDSTQLTLQTGRIVEVVEKMDNGWWRGVVDDHEGWFPSNYLKKIEVGDSAEDGLQVENEVQQQVAVAKDAEKNQSRSNPEGFVNVALDVNEEDVPAKDATKVKVKLRENKPVKQEENVRFSTMDKDQLEGYLNEIFSVEDEEKHETETNKDAQDEVTKELKNKHNEKIATTLSDKKDPEKDVKLSPEAPGQEEKREQSDVSVVGLDEVLVPGPGLKNDEKERQHDQVDLKTVVADPDETDDPEPLTFKVVSVQDHAVITQMVEKLESDSRRKDAEETGCIKGNVSGIDHADEDAVHEVKTRDSEDGEDPAGIEDILEEQGSEIEDIAPIGTISDDGEVPGDKQKAARSRKGRSRQKRKSKRRSDRGKMYVAMYPFTPSDSSQLTLGRNDVVDFMDDEENGWLRGRKRESGDIGWFPKEYVREGEMPPGRMMLTEGSSSSDSENEFDDDVTGMEYRAAHAYTALQEGDLDLTEGDTVIVMETLQSGWWRGYIGEQEGWFPGSYVEPILQRPQTPDSGFTSLQFAAASSSPNEDDNTKMNAEISPIEIMYTAAAAADAAAAAAAGERDANGEVPSTSASNTSLANQEDSAKGPASTNPAPNSKAATKLKKLAFNLRPQLPKRFVVPKRVKIPKGKVRKTKDRPARPPPPAPPPKPRYVIAKDNISADTQAANFAEDSLPGDTPGQAVDRQNYETKAEKKKRRSSSRPSVPPPKPPEQTPDSDDNVKIIYGTATDLVFKGNTQEQQHTEEALSVPSLPVSNEVEDEVFLQDVKANSESHTVVKTNKMGVPVAPSDRDNLSRHSYSNGTVVISQDDDEEEEEEEESDHTSVVASGVEKVPRIITKVKEVRSIFEQLTAKSKEEQKPRVVKTEIHTATQGKKEDGSPDRPTDITPEDAADKHHHSDMELTRSSGYVSDPGDSVYKVSPERPPLPVKPKMSSLHDRLADSNPDLLVQKDSFTLLTNKEENSMPSDVFYTTGQHAPPTKIIKAQDDDAAEVRITSEVKSPPKFRPKVPPKRPSPPKRSTSEPSADEDKVKNTETRPAYSLHQGTLANDSSPPYTESDNKLKWYDSAIGSAGKVNGMQESTASTKDKHEGGLLISSVDDEENIRQLNNRASSPAAAKEFFSKREAVQLTLEPKKVFSVGDSEAFNTPPRAEVDAATVKPEPKRKPTPYRPPRPTAPTMVLFTSPTFSSSANTEDKTDSSKSTSISSSSVMKKSFDPDPSDFQFTLMNRSVSQDPNFVPNKDRNHSADKPRSFNTRRSMPCDKSSPSGDHFGSPDRDTGRTYGYSSSPDESHGTSSTHPGISAYSFRLGDHSNIPAQQADHSMVPDAAADSKPDEPKVSKDELRGGSVGEIRPVRLSMGLQGSVTRSERSSQPPKVKPHRPPAPLMGLKAKSPSPAKQYTATSREASPLTASERTLNSTMEPRAGEVEEKDSSAVTLVSPAVDLKSSPLRFFIPPSYTRTAVDIEKSALDVSRTSVLDDDITSSSLPDLTYLQTKPDVTSSRSSQSASRATVTPSVFALQSQATDASKLYTDIQKEPFAPTPTNVVPKRRFSDTFSFMSKVPPDRPTSPVSPVDADRSRWRLFTPAMFVPKHTSPSSLSPISPQYDSSPNLSTDDHVTSVGSRGDGRPKNDFLVVSPGGIHHVEPARAEERRPSVDDAKKFQAELDAPLPFRRQSQDMPVSPLRGQETSPEPNYGSQLYIKEKAMKKTPIHDKPLKADKPPGRLKECGAQDFRLMAFNDGEPETDV